MSETLDLLKSADEVEPLVLFDYQEPWVPKMKAARRQLIGAEMGLGKTPPTIQAMVELDLDSVFIIGTKRTIMGWLRMMKRWYPNYLGKFTVILRDNVGGQEARKEQWHKRPSFVITTFQIAARDFKFIQRKNYNLLIADELHKFMRRRDTKSRQLLKGFGSIYMFLITGSPTAGKHAGEWWTYLNLLDYNRFKSYWKFVHRYANVVDGLWGKEIFGYQNIDELQTILRQYCILTQKKEIGKHRKVRSFIEVEMESGQRTIYRDLLNDLLHFDPEHGITIVAKNELSVHTKLRQLLVCPAHLDSRLGMGAGLAAVLDRLTDLDRERRHCVIFTPFAKGVIPLLAGFVKGNGLVGDDVIELMGGVGLDELESRLDTWRRRKGIAIVSIQYAESFDMETTDKGFFLGYDWEPLVNTQAEDRIDRAINQFSILNMYYVRHENTVDDYVMDKLIMKSINLSTIYNDPERIRELYGDIKSRWYEEAAMKG